MSSAPRSSARGDASRLCVNRLPHASRVFSISASVVSTRSVVSSASSLASSLAPALASALAVWSRVAPGERVPKLRENALGENASSRSRVAACAKTRRV